MGHVTVHRWKSEGNLWVSVLSFHYMALGNSDTGLGDFPYRAISLALNFILKGFTKEVPALLCFLPFSPWSNGEQPCNKDGVCRCKRVANNGKESTIVAACGLPGVRCCLWNTSAHISFEYVTFEG